MVQWDLSHHASGNTKQRDHAEGSRRISANAWGCPPKRSRMSFELKPPRWKVLVHILAQWGLLPGRGLQILLQFQKIRSLKQNIQAEVEAAGGKMPLWRCWTHPKPQELG